MSHHPGLATLRRTALLGVATAVTIGTLVAPAHAAKTSPKQLSATWLSKQLTGGLIHNNQFDFDDYGLSIDTAFALDAIGGHKKTVEQIGGAVASHVNDYITGEAFGDTGSTYAGPTGKAIVLAQVAEKNPTSFGGVDLVSTLEGTVSTTAPTKGRIVDVSTFGDSANVLGQSFAARGLANAKSPKAKAVTSFLLAQQCKAGYFRLNFTADKTAADQTCDGGKKGSTSAPDTDATALTVINLQGIDKKSAKVKKAVKMANAWLVKAQRKDGSFGGGKSTEKPNTNSTGLAAWALAGANQCKAAVAAAAWTTKFQVVKVAGTPLAGQRGAIAYDKPALRKGMKKGIKVATQDQWRRATAQAAPAMGLLTVKSCRKF
ncbi:MAG: hypothetical protein QM714_00845 [Nocardioides sp.]|uniref:hypothetical protein n=1 Tax=Nocardioides sp. TaxID=35761 RepID=UPI0039E380E1